ncbi:MAG: MetS family NSS transporter small subunit [Bacteroidota bacterium]
MEPLTIVVMVLTLGIVWGGFAFVVTKAMGKEKEKEKQ